MKTFKEFVQLDESRNELNRLVADSANRMMFDIDKTYHADLLKKLNVKCGMIVKSWGLRTHKLNDRYADYSVSFKNDKITLTVSIPVEFLFDDMGREDMIAKKLKQMGFKIENISRNSISTTVKATGKAY